LLRQANPFPKVDCDLHLMLPTTSELLPFLDDYWHEQVTSRGIDRLELTGDISNMPAAIRPDWRGPATLERVQTRALDAFDTDIAICNCLYGAQAVYNADLAAALCGAMNDWLVANWLSKDDRLRASIIVPWQHPELAAKEIERRAPDRRFVQVLLMVLGDRPLGQRSMWPIYAAAEAHGLPIGVHAGSTYRFAPWTNGWPSYHIEDQAAQSVGFQTQLLSMITEGVFKEFPKLRVVLMESGVTWLPSFLWRIDKLWRGLRMEVPWVKRPPSEIVAEHVRLTMQPFDGPKDPQIVREMIEQIGEEMMLFSTDFPHWNFEQAEFAPTGFDAGLMNRLRTENPLKTYPRLQETS
jgi:uncharacterized protein